MKIRKVDLIEALFLLLLAVAMVLGLWVNLAGCAHDGCAPETMRCRANNVEQCDADGDWYVVDHCGQVEPLTWEWTCCAVEPDLMACVPADECDGGTE